jgi:hypothetical protein
MFFDRCLSHGAAILMLALSSPASAQDAVDAENLAVILTAAEVALVSASDFHDRYEQGVEVFSFEANFSARNWSMQAEIILGDGSSGNIQYTGFRWGEEATDWSVDFSGAGQIGEEVISILGTGDWVFNQEIGTHDVMNFSQATKIGSNSWWHFTYAAELILGAAAGVGAGIGTSTVTSPLGGIAIGVTAGTAAANQAVSLSENIRENFFTEDDEVPSPPSARPDVPAVPETGDDLAPQENRTVVVVFNDSGEIEGHGPNENTFIFGKIDYQNNSIAGEVQFR